MWRSVASGCRVGIAVLLAGAPVLAPNHAAASEDPVEPTGRAVCEVAFTAVAAVSFGSYSVPPEVPFGPNDVIVALTPLLRACADRYPPAPTRRCVTTDLYPDTGIPVTPPDPLGVVSEQVEHTATPVGDPVRSALQGPLRDLFTEALACEDPATAPDPGVDRLPLDPDLVATPPAAPNAPRDGEEVAGGGRAPEVASPPPSSAPTSPPASNSRASEPLVALVSAVPEPLRGVAAAGALVLLAALSLVLQRQLSPGRRRSLADVATGGDR